MSEILEGLMKMWRRQRYEFLTGSRIICKTPGFLEYVKMTGTAAATSTVKIYDGESATEQQLCELTGLVTGSDQFNPSWPVPFQRGLYAALGLTASSLTVVIITQKE